MSGLGREPIAADLPRDPASLFIRQGAAERREEIASFLENRR